MLIRFIHLRIRSFKFAFSGWDYVIRTQKNAWIHAFASFTVAILAIWLKLGAIEWAILILTVSAVWMAEMINTALEAVVDLASPDNHPLAKVGKDVGAAAVLVGAFSAVLIGLLILGPPLYEKLIPMVAIILK